MPSVGTLEPTTKRLSIDEGDDQYVAGVAAKAEGAKEDEKVDALQPHSSRKASDLTNYALQFLSNASNETLGACFVGLGASTYLVLGRVGLVLIGVVGGVVLHAACDHDATKGDDEQSRSVGMRKQREKGLDIMSRILNTREGAFSRKLEDNGNGISSNLKEVEFSSFRPETQEALDNFADAVIGNYVKWWYAPLLPKDTLFPIACRQTLTRFISTISNQLSRKRPAGMFLDFLTNSSSIVIVFLSELSMALKQTSCANCAEAIHQYVFDNPESSLANVLDQEQQDKKLKGIADDVLHIFLEANIYNCEPARIFLQQVLAGLVLEGTVTSCATPEFINDWIIYLLEDEQKSELVQAIDAGVSGATANSSVVEDVAASAPLENPAKVSQVNTEHKRTVSRAEAAMEEAMQEAKRLSALIASEEADKNRNSVDGAILGAGMSNGVISSRPQNNDSVNPATSFSSSKGLGESIPVASPAADKDTTRSFNTFDQIVSSKPTALQNEVPAVVAPTPMSLHNASVLIFDDAIPGEKATIKAKPTVEYLLQIEPAQSHYPGWMIARKYPDFETMHEVLRRIAVISGVTEFTQSNPTLPNWKNKTKAVLRVELEQYLRNALSFDRLAESEGMKRFLEKDRGIEASPGSSSKGGIGFPSPAAFETVGKGVLDVLTSAPKGVAGGGKAVVGGVAGVFGAKGQKKQSSPNRDAKPHNTSTTTPPRIDSNTSLSPMRVPEERHYSRSSQERQRDYFKLQESSKPQPSPEESRSMPRAQNDSDLLNGSSADPNSKSLPSHTSENMESELHLPPPPSEIADDYGTNSSSPKPSLDDSITIHTPPSTLQSSFLTPLVESTPPPKPSAKPEFAPLSTEETSVAVELFFATINELYSLSSAWTLRLTLLNAAKSFLLRPGNPSLEAIRQLLQSTIIESQTTDAAIAGHIRTTRENVLPTEEEMKAWPPTPNDEEKERLRRKARKLLVEKGMPVALTSVMGAAASGEALGKVFDCLQVPEVSRALVFALVLQAVRAVTH